MKLTESQREILIPAMERIHIFHPGENQWIPLSSPGTYHRLTQAG